jgi:hypothetical protein
MISANCCLVLNNRHTTITANKQEAKQYIIQCSQMFYCLPSILSRYTVVLSVLAPSYMAGGFIAFHFQAVRVVAR